MIETPSRRLMKLVAAYAPVVPYFASLLAQPVPKLLEPAPAAQPVPEATTQPAAAGADGKPWIAGLDAPSVFIDKAGRAHRVEDLEPAALRQEVEAAIEHSRVPDDAVFPSNESLATASKLLHRHVHDLPADRRIALTAAVARGMVDLEVQVRAVHRPPLTVERFAALMCPHCVVIENRLDVPYHLVCDLAQAGDAAFAALEQRLGGVQEIRRRESALASRRMWISRGTLQPPPLPAREGEPIAADGGTAGGVGRVPLDGSKKIRDHQ